LLTTSDIEGLIGPIILKQYAGRTLNSMSALELREALKDVPGSESLTISYAPSGNQIIHVGEKQVEVSPMASNEEIRAALQNPFVPTRNTKVMTNPIDRLKEKLAKAAGVGGRVAAKIESKADALIAREADLEAKADHAFAPHEAIADQASASLDEIEAAVNLLSNGGPPLHE